MHIWAVIGYALALIEHERSSPISNPGRLLQSITHRQRPAPTQYRSSTARTGLRAFTASVGGTTNGLILRGATEIMPNSELCPEYALKA